MLAVVLALTAALSWGAADFLGGMATRRRALRAVMLVSQVAGLAPVVVLAALAAGPLPSGGDVVSALAGGVAGLLGVSMLYLALAIGTMSVVAPIVALSALVPVAVSFVTGTIPSGIVLPGIALALGGAMLVAVTPDDGTARPEHRSRSLWIAVLSALGFGLALVALDAAAASDPLWTVTIARSCAVAVVMATLAIRPPALELGRPGLWRIVAAGVLDAAAITLFAVASNHGGLAVVSVLASLYPVVTVLLARVILEERLRALQAAGVVLALLGAAVVAAGT